MSQQKFREHPESALVLCEGTLVPLVLLFKPARVGLYPRGIVTPAQRPEREACKTMVGLLALAADGHEAQLAQELQQLIKRDQLPELNALSLLLQPPKTDVPPVVVTLPKLASYDELFGVAA